MKKRRILRSERGFTLVELGIVMAIIAILAAVAYPTYSNMRKRAYIAEAKAILQEIRIDAWAHFVEEGDKFPEWKTIADPATAYDVGNWKFTLSSHGTSSTDYSGPYIVKAEGIEGADDMYLWMRIDASNGSAKFVENSTGTEPTW